MTSRLARIALSVGCGALAFAFVAAAQPAGAPRGQARAVMPVTITIPDTMKVSVREPVPVNAHLGDAVTVRLADRWWDSNWFAAFLSAAVVLLAVFLAQWRKNVANDARRRARLLTRTRGALEAAEVTLRTVRELKPDGTKEFDPQTMKGLILEWRRYDRVSDDIGLLKNPQIEEEIDGILGAARQIAEAALEDERRFGEELGELAKRLGDPIPKQVLEQVLSRHASQRKVRLGQMQYVHDTAQRALDILNARWKPASWHKPRRPVESIEGVHPDPADSRGSANAGP